jgi:hypothetical protein
MWWLLVQWLANTKMLLLGHHTPSTQWLVLVVLVMAEDGRYMRNIV